MRLKIRLAGLHSACTVHAPASGHRAAQRRQHVACLLSPRCAVHLKRRPSPSEQAQAAREVRHPGRVGAALHGAPRCGPVPGAFHAPCAPPHPCCCCPAHAAAAPPPGLQVIPIIDIPGFGTAAAEKVCLDMKIQSQVRAALQQHRPPSAGRGWWHHALLHAALACSFRLLVAKPRCCLSDSHAVQLCMAQHVPTNADTHPPHPTPSPTPERHQEAGGGEAAGVPQGLHRRRADCGRARGQEGGWAPRLPLLVHRAHVARHAGRRAASLVGTAHAESRSTCCCAVQVSEAKPLIKNEMIAAGDAMLYSGACRRSPVCALPSPPGWRKPGAQQRPPGHSPGRQPAELTSSAAGPWPWLHAEPEKPVMSRSGDECVVALTDQW